MIYEAVVEKINGIRRFGNAAGVTVTEQMLQVLGSPQEGMRLVHIAGTNGKGSVSAFLCEILRAAGKKTGVFTSPHLVDFRERICVDGSMISKEAVQRLGTALLEQEFGVSPSMFDYCLAMALLYFKEQQCDVVILETGLGGRLDSTNAVGVPEVCVITKIGYDHMEILGESLEEIAAEKAGIIKKGTAVVTESQKPEVLSVLLQTAKEKGARVCQVIDPKEFTHCCYADGEQQFCYGKYGKLRMRMLGVHQYENAAAAAMAAELFFEREKCAECIGPMQTGEDKLAWMKNCISRGIMAARWKGRMEILREHPFFMVDGAHNSNGVAALRESLQALFPGEKFHFIMGVMADKDYEQMIEELLPLAVDFKTVTVDSARALLAETLAACIQKRGVCAECAADLPSCLAMAQDTNYKTIAFGSLYFVGEIEAVFKNFEEI